MCGEIAARRSPCCVRACGAKMRALVACDEVWLCVGGVHSAWRRRHDLYRTRRCRRAPSCTTCTLDFVLLKQYVRQSHVTLLHNRQMKPHMCDKEREAGRGEHLSGRADRDGLGTDALSVCAACCACSPPPALVKHAACRRGLQLGVLVLLSCAVRYHDAPPKCWRAALGAARRCR
jgi:hypothetical protein